jgi:hypothetical protein
MCLINFKTRLYNDSGIGYKVFKKTITPGKYRGVHFTFSGGYFLGNTYRETNRGLVEDGNYPYGFHIFKILSEAKRYGCERNETIIEVSYSNVYGAGQENGLDVVVAGSMTLLREV